MICGGFAGGILATGAVPVAKWNYTPAPDDLSPVYDPVLSGVFSLILPVTAVGAMAVGA